MAARRVLVIHWGRTGAGPRLTRDLAETIKYDPEFEVVVSFATGGELAEDFLRNFEEIIPVRTYDTAAGALLGLPRALRLALRVRKFVKTTNVEAVVSPMLSLWHSLLIRVIVPEGVQYVATVHDATQHPGDESRIGQFCANKDRARANSILTMSKDVAEKLRQTSQSETPIIESVHPAFRSKEVTAYRKAPSGRVRVGLFGRLKKYKGVETLAGAAAILKERGYDLEFHVVGSEFVPEPNESYEGLQIEDRWVDEAEVNSLVASFDILALPYREASQSGPIAVAMAEGVPVVASPAGGLAEQVVSGSCGLVAEDMSELAFANAIEALLVNPELYEQFSRGGIEAAGGNFSWQRVWGDYKKAIRTQVG